MRNYVGVYGLGVMGQSLTLNIANKGFSVSGYNIHNDVTERFIKQKVTTQPILATYSLQEFVDSLEKPRKIILMVTAGKVVDIVVDSLIPYLEEGDIIVDGGNSFYKDTIRRCESLKAKGIFFFGAGISGGERGALQGPSIMPSGDKDVYAYLEPVLDAIAAKTEDGQVCSTYLGPDGAGHYVKMVHNGIEYCEIWIICEIYQLMKMVGCFSHEEIIQTFISWKQTRLNSYLIDITIDILQRNDEKTNKPLVDSILDVAGQKGTGKWTAMEGLDIGVPIPTICEAVLARYLTSYKDQRVRASQKLNSTYNCLSTDKEKFTKNLADTITFVKISVYSQGFWLLKEAGAINNWPLPLGEIAQIWRNGCIIRSDFLTDVEKAFKAIPSIENLYDDPKMINMALKYEQATRQIVADAILHGCPIPIIASTLTYYDSYRIANSSANLLQALRDYFGAHTYQRVDADPSEFFHTIWEEYDFD